jgi:hypothetical protein
MKISSEIEPLFEKLPDDFSEKVVQEILPRVREKIQDQRPDHLRF